MAYFDTDSNSISAHGAGVDRWPNFIGIDGNLVNLDITEQRILYGIEVLLPVFRWHTSETRPKVPRIQLYNNLEIAAESISLRDFPHLRVTIFADKQLSYAYLTIGDRPEQTTWIGLSENTFAEVSGEELVGFLFDPV